LIGSRVYLENKGDCIVEKIPVVSPAEIHRYAVEKGWWDNDRPVPELLCLIHSEISEALEGYRERIPEGEKGNLGEELADAVIRIWDMCDALGIDIINEIEKKHLFNLTRPYRHGNKRC
jgi:NTP pyrophosphatase (non-canonical NTP hydrolase)